MTTERNARKEPMSDPEADALIREAENVWIAKGRKLRELAAADVGPDDIKGPTGNVRAPVVRRGANLLVGFNLESLERLLDA